MLNILTSQYGLDKDDLISSLPFILMEVRGYTNQYFLTNTNARVSKIVDNKVYIEHSKGTMYVGDTIELFNSVNNNSLYFIKEITDEYIELEGYVQDELDNPNIIAIKLSFKGVNGRTIKGMVDYDNHTEGISGIKSQNLGGYSVTYGDTKSGDGGLSTSYPSELYGSLNALRKINDDGMEYVRYGYVRV